MTGFLPCLMFFVLGCSGALVNLGAAGSFAVLAATPSVTNTGLSIINGDVGLTPGTIVTGFPPGVVVPPFAFHVNDGSATAAKADLTSAHIAASGLTGTDLSATSNLGTQTLTPGVYTFTSSASLTGTVTLDFQGNPAAEFVFVMTSTLITSTGSRVSIVNGGNGCNVYWIVGSSATIEVGSSFEGHVLALTDITVKTGAVIQNGSFLARNGQITLDSTSILSTTCFVAQDGNE